MVFVPVNAAQLVPPTGIFETVGGGFPVFFPVPAGAGRGLVVTGRDKTENVHSPSLTQIDASFRDASMIKVVTSVAAMQLVEQGKIALDAPAPAIDPALASRTRWPGFAALSTALSESGCGTARTGPRWWPKHPLSDTVRGLPTTSPPKEVTSPLRATGGPLSGSLVDEGKPGNYDFMEGSHDVDGRDAPKSW
jgi:hypothetical protein